MDLLSLGFVALELRDSPLVAEPLTKDLEESKKHLSNEKCLNIITLDEIARHDCDDDCWIAIYDFVYNCTNFIKKHPGGHEVLVEYAGRDATLAFIGSGHTKVAINLLENYLIGELPLCERLYRKPGGIQIVTVH